ncbi:MBL fold metallo-hydrolase [candidate division KSB1 bacterium]|nr:MBL fold metallo-hydrolase [candidate division KSB1 bacterium]
MKISNSVHALKHIFYIPVGPDQKLERFVYSYIIFGKKSIHLIDSGVADSSSAILEYVVQQGRPVNEINTLILTHSHPDHIGSARLLKDQIGCQVLAHQNERSWIEDVDQQFADRPVPGFKTFVNQSVKVDRCIDDGDVLELDNELSIRVYRTPGHSSGSISMYLPSEHVLFCGDAILLPGSLPIYDDMATAVSSLEKLQRIDGIQHLLSSWDDPCDGAAMTEKIQQSIGYFRKIHQVVSGVENAKTLAPMELCERVIPQMGLPPVAVNPLVARSFQSNLNISDNR